MSFKFNNSIKPLLLLIVVFGVFFSCGHSKTAIQSPMIPKEKDISNQFSAKEFKQLRTFVFNNGNRLTFRNFDNNNPHCKRDGIDLFFGTFQQHFGKNPMEEDYTELIIRVKEEKINYITLKLDDDKVYLVDVYRKGFQELETVLKKHLNSLKNTNHKSSIKNHKS